MTFKFVWFFRICNVDSNWKKGTYFERDMFVFESPLSRQRLLSQKKKVLKIVIQIQSFIPIYESYTLYHSVVKLAHQTSTMQFSILKPIIFQKKSHFHFEISEISYIICNTYVLFSNLYKQVALNKIANLNSIICDH